MYYAHTTEEGGVGSKWEDFHIAAPLVLHLVLSLIFYKSAKMLDVAIFNTNKKFVCWTEVTNASKSFQYVAVTVFSSMYFHDAFDVNWSD